MVVLIIEIDIKIIRYKDIYIRTKNDEKIRNNKIHILNNKYPKNTRFPRIASWPRPTITPRHKKKQYITSPKF